MEVLIVPIIAAPLSNRTHYEALKLSYLQVIKLANPMIKDKLLTIDETKSIVPFSINLIPLFDKYKSC